MLWQCWWSEWMFLVPLCTTWAVKTPPASIPFWKSNEYWTKGSIFSPPPLPSCQNNRNSKKSTYSKNKYIHLQLYSSSKGAPSGLSQHLPCSPPLSWLQHILHCSLQTSSVAASPWGGGNVILWLRDTGASLAVSVGRQAQRVLLGALNSSVQHKGHVRVLNSAAS